MRFYLYEECKFSSYFFNFGLRAPWERRQDACVPERNQNAAIRDTKIEGWHILGNGADDFRGPRRFDDLRNVDGAD